MTGKYEFVNIQQELYRNMFFYGGIGFGKTCALKKCAESYHDYMKYKILDLFGGERNEGEFWALPSDNELFWRSFEQTAEFNARGPKQYYVHLLYPLWKERLPDKLPESPKSSPFVKSKVFTIPIKSLTLRLVEFVLGKLSQTTISIFYNIMRKVKKPMNGADLMLLCHKMHIEKSLIYNNFFLPLIENNLLSDEYGDYNLDLLREMRDKKTISVLSLNFVPEQFKLFIMGWILENLKELLESNKLKNKRNIIMVREASYFMKASDDSIMPDNFKKFRAFITDCVRYARRGMHFMMDTQSACLDENTLISYYDNEIKIKKIKDLPNKFNAISYNFHTKKTEVKEAFKNDSGLRDCYEIELENGKKVIASKEHRFFNENKLEVSTICLNTGDKLLCNDINKKRKNPNCGFKKGNIPYNKGKKHSKKTRKLISINTKIAMNNPVIKRKISVSKIGKKLSEECKQKISKANKGNLKLKRSLRKFYREKGISETTRQKLSKSTKKLWKNKEYRNKVSQGGWKMHWRGREKIRQSKLGDKNPAKRADARIKNSISSKLRWKNDKYKHNWIKALLKTKPNKKEKLIIKIINKNKLPFDFVGSGKVWITGKNNKRYNPDFISKDKNKIIEHFGTYFHNNRQDNDKQRLEAYKKAGYAVLVIKEKEMNDIENIANKIIGFSKQ